MKKASTSQRILIIVKAHNTHALNLAAQIASWLTEQQYHVTVLENTHDLRIYNSKSFRLALVLGGDGTMLGVARAFVHNPIPLVGINFGRVGFLAELESASWQAGLQVILEEKHTLLKRMALGWRVYRNEAVVYEGYAVNDVVISRGALSRVVTLDVGVDTEHISRIRADGIIFSSPVGSTGYAVSAGGPLVHPANNNILVTAICPYLCNFPAMVLPHTMSVHVILHQCSIETFVSVDGQENYLLATKDRVEVFCLPETVYFARIKEDRYFTPLRERGFIQGLQ